MPVENDWKRFFNADYAPKYEEEIFTRNTLQEVEFIVKEFGLPAGAKILDTGCGTCRHSIELAKRGCRMTGVDLSPAMLEIARRKAESAGVSLKLVESDAVKMRFNQEFDGAICLCEGAMSLLGGREEALEHDNLILRNIYAALRPGAKLIISALSSVRWLRSLDEKGIADGQYDLTTMTGKTVMPVKMDGMEQDITLYERYYSPPEFAVLLENAGFEVIGIYGGEAPNWGKNPLTLEEWELMAIGLKQK